MQIAIKRSNNLSQVARKCYERYKDYKRRDGTLLWRNASGVICVLSKACWDGEIPSVREENRRVYLELDAALEFLDAYVGSRAYGKSRDYELDPYKVYSKSRGRGERKKVEPEVEPEPVVDPYDWEFGWLSRQLGINRVYDALMEIKLSIDELVKVWKS